LKEMINHHVKETVCAKLQNRNTFDFLKTETKIRSL